MPQCSFLIFSLSYYHIFSTQWRVSPVVLENTLFEASHQNFKLFNPDDKLFGVLPCDRTFVKPSMVHSAKIDNECALLCSKFTKVAIVQVYSSNCLTNYFLVLGTNIESQVRIIKLRKNMKVRMLQKELQFVLMYK